MFGDQNTWWWPTHTQFADFYEDLEDLACKHLNLLDCWLSISEAGCMCYGVSLVPGDLTLFQYLQTFMTSFVGLADGFSDPKGFCGGGCQGA